MKAIFNHKTIAESDKTISFDGSTYFPANSIVPHYFIQSDDYTTTCSVKGTGTYYTIMVNGEARDHASWAYHHPTTEAAHIKDHFAFWKGIKIEK